MPLTTDTLAAELDTIDYPVRDAFAQAAASALAEEILFMRIWHGRKIYTKATEMVQDWFSDAKWDVTAENLAARKQLEEIRLRMTAEVNETLTE